MLIDDRWNFFMSGASISLIAVFPRSLWYLLGVIAIILIGALLMKKFKALGGGDINSLSWIFIGFALINPVYLITFVILLTIITLLYQLIKYIVAKIFKRNPNDPTPFYPVILLSFLINCFVYKLFS